MPEVLNWDVVQGRVVEIKMKTREDLEAFATAVGRPILIQSNKYFVVLEGIFYSWAKVQ